MTDIDKIKYLAKKYHKKINSICMPLYKMLGCDLFYRVQVLADKLTIVSTNLDWLNNYLNSGRYKNNIYVKQSNITQEMVVLWQDGVGFNLLKPNKKGYRIYGFGCSGKRSARDFSSQAFSDTYLFKYFVNYFEACVASELSELSSYELEIKNSGIYAIEDLAIECTLSKRQVDNFIGSLVG